MLILGFAKILVVGALIKLLLETDKPAMCAGIYAVLASGLSLLFVHSVVGVLIALGIRFGLAYAYFWLLARFQDSGVFWLIMILGIVVGLV